MAKRAIPWCEVQCSNCGDVVGLHYRNAKTISRLKKATETWIYCDEEGNLCPECYKKLKKKNR